jgi:UDP-3-O-[3-hydroxymyristoyl] N-acetylglucosamine deacetylase
MLAWGSRRTARSFRCSTAGRAPGRGRWRRSRSRARAATPRTVTRAATVDVGRSRYAFRPAARASVAVNIEFDDARVAPSARWSGDADDFVRRVAPARTFCFARELDELSRNGLAAFATPEAVMVIGETILAVGAPYAEDEPARHKLLDLIGDLYLYGGPPRGEVHAHRPGHSVTHEAMRIALDQGIIA